MNEEIKNTANASNLQLKGTNYGIRIIFPDDLTDDALLELFATVPEGAYVLPMGRGIVLDFQAKPCSERLIAKILREVVWPKELRVLAWLTTDKDSQKRLKRAGFHVTEPLQGHADLTAGSNVVILNHSLRSGQCEEHDGDVVLVGHLNDGAELYAGGSVFVLGKLKGLVHAGCNRVDGICVVTGSFEARQLRIGDKLCDQFGKWWRKPVIITLEDDGLLIREWAVS